LAAARTGILDAQPVLDARLVKDVALAAIPASRNHCVSVPKVLEANGAAAAASVAVAASMVAIALFPATSAAASTRGAGFGFFGFGIF